MPISSRLYQNIVTQFFAGICYCKIRIYDADSIFCQNVASLYQLEAEIMADSVFFQNVVCHYVSHQKVMKSPLYVYDNNIVWLLSNQYISKHLTSVDHNNSTLKWYFLRFCGSSEIRNFEKKTQIHSKEKKIGIPEKL